jgi:hypothetical protein
LLSQHQSLVINGYLDHSNVLPRLFEATLVRHHLRECKIFPVVKEILFSRLKTEIAPPQGSKVDGFWLSPGAPIDHKTRLKTSFLPWWLQIYKNVE